MRDTEVVEVVRRELRLAGLFTERDFGPHPPRDVDAESELCSAVLCGDFKTKDFAVRASDFYSVILAHVWVALEAVTELELEPTDRVVLATLAENGYRGLELVTELKNLRTQPFCLESRLLTHAQRITELARRRELISSLQKLTLDLSNGTTLTEARAVLAKLSGL